MTREKKIAWGKVPWTSFERVPVLPGEVYGSLRPPDAVFVNSIYQVSVWFYKEGPLGKMAHLSFKTHDKQARHDWREMQMIKNEIISPEAEAVELFPAESRLVDTSNQYHLWVFTEGKLPFGFDEGRLVAEASWDTKDKKLKKLGMTASNQRPFRPECRPKDVIPSDEINAKLDAFYAKSREEKERK